MRVRPETKARTRGEILKAARRLFAERGFARASTRELSRSAGIAAGTLFNYFPTKESLALELLGESIERGLATWHARRRSGASLVEELFDHVACGLAELEPYRASLGEILETALSPFRSLPAVPGGERFRLRHLETVDALLREHGHSEGVGPVSMHLYWTLYLGVLAYWSADGSPHQEDTLGVLDQALGMFAGSLVLDGTEDRTHEEAGGEEPPRIG